MPSYLLDTCAWIDALLFPERLRPAVRNVIDAPEPLFLSNISLLEVARKERAGDITLSMSCGEWFARVALPAGKIILLDILPDIAVDATRLPEPFVNRQGKPHKDPADQIIVGTARHHDLTLITSDRTLIDYPHVRTMKSRK